LGDERNLGREAFRVRIEGRLLADRLGVAAAVEAKFAAERNMKI
jgi:hypothetical protein